KAVVGNADGLNLAALCQWDQVWRPSLHIHRVVNPVDVDYIRMQALLAAINHVLHGIGSAVRNLRRKLGGQDHVLSVQSLYKVSQDALRSSLAVYGSGVPQVQSQLHCLIKDRLQIILKQMVSKHLISTGGTGAPGP